MNHRTFLVTLIYFQFQSNMYHAWLIEVETKWPPFSNGLSLMKMYEFRLKFHWTLFPRSNWCRLQEHISTCGNKIQNFRFSGLHNVSYFVQASMCDWYLGVFVRCSAAFFAEERAVLHTRRMKIRMLQQRKGVDSSELKDLPQEIPMPLVIGTKVTGQGQGHRLKLTLIYGVIENRWCSMRLGYLEKVQSCAKLSFG